MIIRLKVSVKNDGVWFAPGKRVVFDDKIAEQLVETDQAEFVGLKCPECRTIITADSIEQANRKLGGHQTAHRKETKKQEAARKRKEKKEAREKKEATEKKEEKKKEGK